MNATAIFSQGANALQPVEWLKDRLAAAPATPTFKMHVLLDGETIEIAQPLRHQLLCAQGTLWITHDGWPDDHIIEHGQRYQAATDSRMLVHALGAARVQVCSAPA